MVAKRVSLYLARISPQGTIDHLVYQLAQRMLEESLESSRPTVHKSDIDGNFVLEFSQGSAASQLAAVMDIQPYTSPLLVHGSHDSLLRNGSGSLMSKAMHLGGRMSLGPVIPLPPEMSVGRSGHRV